MYAVIHVTNIKQIKQNKTKQASVKIFPNIYYHLTLQHTIDLIGGVKF